MSAVAKSGRDVWNVDEAEFPSSGPLEHQLRFALRYAVLAPSSHNSQPWRFDVRGDRVDVYADRTRRLPVVDPEDRELVISCGAALLHLRLALAHFGLAAQTTALPNPDQPDLLARVPITGRAQPSTSDDGLFAAIRFRRTNRQAFAERPLARELLEELRQAATSEGAGLHVVGDLEREALAELIAEGDRAQWSDPGFRRELAQWLRPNWGRTEDGIPGYAQGMSDFQSLAGPLLVRTFDMGSGMAAKDRAIASGSPALAVLWTADDTLADWLRVGQALARVLLSARAQDVWASFLNQPIEVPALRPRVRTGLALEGAPQLVLRLGYGPDTRPTPRRPVDAVLLNNRRSSVISA